MPEKKPTPADPPSAELVLAAIDRAWRHRNNQSSPGAGLPTIKEHLGLPRDGAATLRLRPTWDALEGAGLIEQFHRQGITLWNLTTTGRRRLTAARKKTSLTLPESPQHRKWQVARTEAANRIEGFRKDLRLLLAQAGNLLDTEPPAGSDAWWALDKQLHQATRRVGSAIHCLFEWPEPDDATADHAPPGQLERRGYELWPTTPLD